MQMIMKYYKKKIEKIQKLKFEFKRIKLYGTSHRLFDLSFKTKKIVK